VPGKKASVETMAVTSAEDGLEENLHRPFFLPKAIRPAIVNPCVRGSETMKRNFY